MGGGAVKKNTLYDFYLATRTIVLVFIFDEISIYHVQDIFSDCKRISVVDFLLRFSGHTYWASHVKDRRYDIYEVHLKRLVAIFVHIQVSLLSVIMQRLSIVMKISVSIDLKDLLKRSADLYNICLFTCV